MAEGVRRFDFLVPTAYCQLFKRGRSSAESERRATNAKVEGSNPSVSSNFGFWILDFGLRLCARKCESKIQNRQSKIQNRFAGYSQAAKGGGLLVVGTIRLSAPTTGNFRRSDEHIFE